MSDLIDIKTKKKYYEDFQKTFNKTLFYEKLEIEIVNTWDSWGKFQQQWCNNAFNTFKDYDKYLLLIYLFRQVMQSYADKFQYLSMTDFYSREEFTIDKINLTQISYDLKIPKETIRRKINEFQSSQILKRRGKQIVLNKAMIELQMPKITLELLTTFIHKQTIFLHGIETFGDPLEKDQIKSYFQKYFTVFWLRFLKLQIPYLIRWRMLFKDLETFNVWGVVALNHQYNFKKIYEKNIYKESNKVNINNFYTNIIATKVDHGINASSISDVSNIPRATVIRKLKWLKKEGLVKRNRLLEYLMKPKGKKNKRINILFIENRGHIVDFVIDVLDLIKNSNFKI